MFAFILIYCVSLLKFRSQYTMLILDVKGHYSRCCLPNPKGFYCQGVDKLPPKSTSFILQQSVKL